MFASKTTTKKVPSTGPPGSRGADAPSLQRKLEVGPAGDPMEEEADNTADRVMRMPDGRGGAAMDGATQSFMSSRMGGGRQGGATRAVQRQEDPDKEDPDKEALLEALKKGDAPIFLSRLRALTSDESDSLLADPEFWTQIETVFHASALWSVFTILFFKGKMSQAQRRLAVALFSKNIDNAMDALAIIIVQEPMQDEQYWDILKEVVFATFATDPKLIDLFRLIIQGEDSLSSGPRKLSFAQNEVHYDTAPGAGVSLRSFGGNPSSVVNATTSEFRVVVTIRFVDGNDPQHPNNPPNQQPYYFGGNVSGIPDKWADAIRKVWNNRFELNNGIRRLRLTVSPVFTSEVVPADRIISIFNPGQKCPGVAEKNRANAGCWFTNTQTDTVTHEFGHLLGAGDEYNLPQTTAQIPAKQLAGLSPTERSLTTLSGLRGLPKNLGDVHTTSCGSPSQGNCIEGQMGYHNDSTEVKGRHILLLINAFNASLPPGAPPYSIAPLKK